MNDDCFMHIQGGKLYGTSITCQVLWDVLILPNGLNTSKVRPGLTFLLSYEKSRYKLSNDFHASPSAGCLNTLSFVQPSTCHLILCALRCDMNNLCNLGINGNQHNTLAGRFLLVDIGWPSSSKSTSSFHLDCPHLRHESKSLLSFQNNIQSLWHTGIFSYPSPMSLRNFFT
jgi:hypothetical protein